MHNKYLDHFIQQFIHHIIPKGKKALILDKNRKIISNISEKYDYIILVNLLEKEHDILSLLEKIYQHLSENGRLIIIYRNYLHSFFIGLFKSFIKQEYTDYNWLATSDIKTFLKLTNFELFINEPLCFTEAYIPIISSLLNKLILHIFPIDHLSFLQYIIAIKKPPSLKSATVSIIVPARNERGTIEKLFHSLPTLGPRCEIIFIEDHSTDNTLLEMKRCLQLFPNKKNRSFRLLILKKEAGKAAGVRLGFDNAKGDIIIIYDADMTIPAADLLKFYTALITRKGDFINGSRLVYPVGKGAMQLLNILGNKFFTILYSWLLGQQIKDTLCGTKAFWRKDYLEIKRNVDFLKSQDPFGDFYLLLGASRLNLKIIDLPVRYCERTYGSTNIKRFKHAWQLFMLSLFSIKKFKMRM